MTVLEDLHFRQEAVWIGSSIGAVGVLILIGVACRCRCKRQLKSSATSDDHSIALRFFGVSSSKEEGASGGTAVDQTESSSLGRSSSSSGWESSDDESSSSASSSWSYSYSLEGKSAAAAATDDPETAVRTTTTPKSVSDSQNNGKEAVQPATVPMTCPISLSRSDLVGTTNDTTDRSYKSRRASFGAMARRILAESGGASRQSSRRDLDDSSIYSGSTLSIFGGSSVASEDIAGHHNQSLPLPDAATDWFAFKQEAGLHDEDTENQRRRSCLESKTLHPMRFQL